ncbi:MAG: starch-binding protein [Bacilli bacterium]|nr:starch-binding protein [Bacilli bacterium]
MKTSFLFLGASALLALAACNTTPSQSSVSKGTSSEPPQVSSYSAEVSFSEDSEEDDTPTPMDNTHRTWYQLLVYSFADGAGNDGIGDFKGIVDHLDYLQDLGVGGLWLSPIHPAASYHGYDVKDYEAVNSVYEKGGVTFEKLLEECHKRDIKVALDMVLNHTSSDHPWRNSHRDWYSGETAFGGGMPDLNYDKGELRKEIKRICRNWLKKGVDGFRCDAAAWIYGGGGSWQVEQNTFQKSIAWWKEWSADMRAEKEDVYLVGEIYTDLQYIEQFYDSTMNAFNFSACYWARDAINNGNAANWVNEVVNHQNKVRSKYAGAIEASFLSNHDTGRFKSAMNIGSEVDLKFANGLNVISPGGSYIYYGDELGMTGSSNGWQDMSYRTPMPFAKGQTKPNNYMEGRDASTQTQSGKSADEDAKNANSIYSYTAKVARLKNEHPDLYSGKVGSLSSGSGDIGAYFVDGHHDYLVVINAGNQVREVQTTGEVALVGDLSTNGKIEANGGSYKIPAKSIMVLSAKGTVSINGSSASGSGDGDGAASYSFDGVVDENGSNVTQEVSGELKIHFFNAEQNFAKPTCYAWIDNNGPKYLGGWPGSEMTKNGLWYDITISHGAANVIFSDNGGNQTEDLHREKAGEYWFVPSNNGGSKLTGTWYKTNPNPTKK